MSSYWVVEPTTRSYIAVGAEAPVLASAADIGRVFKTWQSHECCVA